LVLYVRLHNFRETFFGAWQVLRERTKNCTIGLSDEEILQEGRLAAAEEMMEKAYPMSFPKTIRVWTERDCERELPLVSRVAPKEARSPVFFHAGLRTRVKGQE
jgi:hypothetical protein